MSGLNFSLHFLALSYCGICKIQTSSLLAGKAFESEFFRVSLEPVSGPLAGPRDGLKFLAMVPPFSYIYLGWLGA